MDGNALSEAVAGFSFNEPAIRFERQPSALSLNIAQSCNLSCSYCYADEGRFGGSERMMPMTTAAEAIRRHISESSSQSLSIGFIGGEPLLNCQVLHESVKFALEEAARKGVDLTFGITTNGTLLQSDDLTLLREHRFAVTVSLDGGRETHDAIRKTRKGAGSSGATLSRIKPLLARPGLASIAARATVTRRNLNIGDCVEALAEEGFGEIGISPLRSGPDPSLYLQDADWPILLEEMKKAAAREWARARYGVGPLRFSNFAVALKHLHKGSFQALPCGSAATYVSVSADGHYYTCHRSVGDPALALGDVLTGVSSSRRRAFVEERRVEQTGAVPLVLGSLSLRRRVPRGGDQGGPGGLRLHSRLAGILHIKLSARVG